MGWRDLKDRGYLSSFQSWDREDSRKVNEGGFPGGAFIPEVPKFFIERHATRESYIWDPMAGTGTTGLVAEGYGIPCLMTDLTPVKPCIMLANAANVFVAKIEDRTDPILEEIFPDLSDTRGYFAAPYSGRAFSDAQTVKEMGLERMLFDLIIWHPPYHNIIKYSDRYEDLSVVDTVEEFMEKLYNAAANIIRHLAPKGFLCMVIGDVWEDRQVVPLGLIAPYAIASMHGMLVKAIAVKDIRGNRANKGYHLRLSRLAKSGAVDFKHEYMISIQNK